MSIRFPDTDEYIGIELVANEICAIYYNPDFLSKDFALTEIKSYELIVEAQELIHLESLGLEPNPPAIAIKLQAHKQGLAAIQAKKRDLGIPLQVPPLEVIEAVANTNHKFTNKLDWHYHVLRTEIERREKLRNSTEKVIHPFAEPG